jgi:predicted SprT family Zn-dependent metalloprotease
MKITINQSEWTIHEVESSHNMLVLDGGSCRGTTHFKQQEIYIDNSFKDEKVFQVLCHELSHAYLYETQLDIGVKYNEEMLCEFIGLYGKPIVDTALAYMGFRKKKQA